MTCLEALAAIEADPLDLPAEVEAHVRGCSGCSEARVTWLALDDAPAALAPAGYFDQLPSRIVRKLPTRPRAGGGHGALWALAAGLLMAVGAGGFWLGRANRQPLVEATYTPAAAELPAALPETPFMEGEDEVAQLRKLTPEKADTVLEGLEPKPAKDPKP
ncbi:hypothetical protein [Mesoterricola silvestris]|uniref:Zinc-finger domain-containing protein n=1 Tax=Mesoterricola silvestris TaxID=2927979 RepID=A0AA48GI54_9BACT|nr:hypothetical protein [Mesoterricola silvestris]BDU73361.1 hypothetical protein METEAL_25350 [Mesoterricola silvestris]